MQNLNPAHESPSYLPHAAVSPRAAVWSLLTGMALALPLVYLMRLLPLPASDAQMLHTSAARIADWVPHPWRLAFRAVLLFPVLEECVYRGLILQMLRRYLPLWLAVLVPTVIFAATHLGFSWDNAVQALILGVIFAGLALRSRSLFPAILCHAGVNLASLFVLRPVFLAAGLDTPDAATRPLALFWLAGSLVVAVAGVRILAAEFGRREPGLAVPAALPLASA